MLKLAVTLGIAIMTAVPAFAGNTLLMPDGLSRAQAVTLHCTTDNFTTTPCGVASQPLIVAPVAGVATAGNQAAEIAGQQALLQSIGGQLDGAYGGVGAGTMVAILKAVASSLANGVAAVPIGGQPLSRSRQLVAAVSTQLFAANSGRRYLAFQAPLGAAIWVNLAGGAAAPNCPDCAYLAPGSLYESGSFVNQGSISVYSSIATAVAAWEY